MVVCNWFPQGGFTGVFPLCSFIELIRGVCLMHGGLLSMFTVICLVILGFVLWGLFCCFGFWVLVLVLLEFTFKTLMGVCTFVICVIEFGGLDVLQLVGLLDTCCV